MSCISPASTTASTAACACGCACAGTAAAAATTTAVAAAYVVENEKDEGKYPVSVGRLWENILLEELGTYTHRILDILDL
ncbi:hypothetical protein GGR51DRAFT_554487 [Nemania sp. FL0031]|nr:hypothetical protein GGR51DRAFT_554487 [Nemania sp. FL0031]